MASSLTPLSQAQEKELNQVATLFMQKMAPYLRKEQPETLSRHMPIALTETGPTLQKDGVRFFLYALPGKDSQPLIGVLPYLPATLHNLGQHQLHYEQAHGDTLGDSLNPSLRVGKNGYFPLPDYRTEDTLASFAGYCKADLTDALRIVSNRLIQELTNNGYHTSEREAEQPTILDCYHLYKYWESNADLGENKSSIVQEFHDKDHLLISLGLDKNRTPSFTLKTLRPYKERMFPIDKATIRTPSFIDFVEQGTLLACNAQKYIENTRTNMSYHQKLGEVQKYELQHLAFDPKHQLLDNVRRAADDLKERGVLVPDIRKYLQNASKQVLTELGKETQRGR